MQQFRFYSIYIAKLLFLCFIILQCKPKKSNSSLANHKILKKNKQIIDLPVSNVKEYMITKAMDKYPFLANMLKELQHGKQIDVNQPDPNMHGQTGLHQAAALGEPAILQILLADPNISILCKDDYGNTPLHIAAKAGNTVILQCLVPKLNRLQLNEAMNSGYTALELAVQNDHLQSAFYLLDNNDTIVSQKTLDIVREIQGKNHLAIEQKILQRFMQHTNNDSQLLTPKEPVNNQVEKLPKSVNNQMQEVPQIAIVEKQKAEENTPNDSASIHHQAIDTPNKGKTVAVLDTQDDTNSAQPNIQQPPKSQQDEVEFLQPSKKNNQAISLKRDNDAGQPMSDLVKNPIMEKTNTGNLNVIGVGQQNDAAMRDNLDITNEDEHLYYLEASAPSYDSFDVPPADKPQLAQQTTNVLGEDQVKFAYWPNQLHPSIQTAAEPMKANNDIFAIEHKKIEENKTDEKKTNDETKIEDKKQEDTTPLIEQQQNCSENIKDQVLTKKNQENKTETDTKKKKFIKRIMPSHWFKKNRSKKKRIKYQSLRHIKAKIINGKKISRKEINSQNVSQQTYLHQALLPNQDSSICLKLIEKGAQINLKDKRGNEPLNIALAMGNIPVSSQLIDKQVNLNTTNEDGKTPLHFACQAGSLEAVKKLLNSGQLDVNQQDNTGKTAIHYLLFKTPGQDQIDILRLLLNKKPKLDLKDKDGETILDFAQALLPKHNLNSQTMIEMIEKAYHMQQYGVEDLYGHLLY